MSHQAKEEAPARWRVRFICCGRDHFVADFDSWAEADRARQDYCSGPGARPCGRLDLSGHERAGIIEAIAAPPPPVSAGDAEALYRRLREIKMEEVAPASIEPGWERRALARLVAEVRDAAAAEERERLVAHLLRRAEELRDTIPACMAKEPCDGRPIPVSKTIELLASGFVQIANEVRAVAAIRARSREGEGKDA